MSCPFAQQSQQQQSAAALSHSQAQAYSSHSRESRSRHSPSATAYQQSFSQSRKSTGRHSFQRSQSYNQNAGAGANFNSNVEQQVINSKQPIETNERETVQAGQYRGIYLNKSEVDQFRGQIPIEQYQINEDPNPEYLKKRLDKLKYKQEVAIRYLNPPLAPKPGDLIVKEKHRTIPPAPPVVLRQEGKQARTPEPLVYREAPPKRPACIPQQVVEVEGAPVPPPARRVVVEKLSNLPPKPQNVIIEKWLPYKQQKRRVVYQKSCVQAPQNPKNLIIEWEAPDVETEQVCKELGVVNADPEEYVRKYGNELKSACEIPNLCPCSRPGPAPTPLPAQDCGCPQQAPRSPTPPPPPTPRPATPQCGGCQQQQQQQQPSQSRAGSAVPELEGDVDALRLVDLDRYGLSAYKRYVH